MYSLYNVATTAYTVENQKKKQLSESCSHELFCFLICVFKSIDPVLRASAHHGKELHITVTAKGQQKGTRNQQSKKGQAKGKDKGEDREDKGKTKGSQGTQGQGERER